MINRERVLRSRKRRQENNTDKQRRRKKEQLNFLVEKHSNLRISFNKLFITKAVYFMLDIEKMKMKKKIISVLFYLLSILDVFESNKILSAFLSLCVLQGICNKPCESYIAVTVILAVKERRT